MFTFSGVVWAVIIKCCVPGPSLILSREVKGFSGDVSQSAFRDRFNKAFQQISGDGEVFFQIPDGKGQNFLDALNKYASQPRRDLTKYSKVRITAFTGDGQIIYEGPLQPVR